MKLSNSWTHDLEFGEKSEDWVKSLFSGGLKVEVKSDRMAHITGNIYIEVYSRGQKSGISTTDADYWIYRIDEHDSAIIISTKRLRELVKRHYKGTFVEVKSYTPTKGVLIPLEDLWR